MESFFFFTITKFNPNIFFAPSHPASPSMPAPPSAHRPLPPAPQLPLFFFFQLLITHHLFFHLLHFLLRLLLLLSILNNLSSESIPLDQQSNSPVWIQFFSFVFYSSLLAPFEIWLHLITKKICRRLSRQLIGCPLLRWYSHPGGMSG